MTMATTRVHRTLIPIQDVTELSLRGYRRTIHVAPARDAPRQLIEIWYEAADIDDDMRVRFWVHGTGHVFTHTADNAPHVGTILTDGGKFVWHIYAEYPLSEALS